MVRLFVHFDRYCESSVHHELGKTKNYSSFDVAMQHFASVSSSSTFVSALCDRTQAFISLKYGSNRLLFELIKLVKLACTS